MLTESLTELESRERLPTLRHLANGGRIDALLTHEALARLMVQTSRQTGLSEVYSEILTFRRSPFYVCACPEMIGLEFGELQSRLQVPDSHLTDLLTMLRV